MRLCKRCLINELGSEELVNSIAELINIMPEDKKAAAEVFYYRIKICETCKKQINGTCILCGCYVDLRASKKHMNCPAVPSKW